MEDREITAEIEIGIEEKVVRKLTLRLIPFLFLLYIVAYLDRINVGFAALQMQAQLGLSDKVFGFGAGVFFAGYFVFQVPSNLVVQRVGARRWIAVLMVTWGVISASMVVVSGRWSLYILRFLLGAAEAGFFPGIIFYLKNWFPAGARARTVARFMTAAPLAGVLGGPVSGALLDVRGAGLAGWQWMFLMEGIPAVVLGGLALAYLVDRPEDARWLSDNERGWLLAALRREAEQAMVSNAGTFAALRMGRLWLLALVYFGLNTASYGVSFWLPTMIRSLSGVSNVVVGVLSAVPYLCAAMAMVEVGLRSDRSGERRWHTALPAFMGAIALGGAAVSTSVRPEIVFLSVAVVGVFSMMGPFWAMPTGFLPATGAAAGIAVINSVGNLGGFAGPSVIGWLRTSTGNFTGGLLAVGAALAVSGMAVLTIKARGNSGA